MRLSNDFPSWRNTRKSMTTKIELRIGYCVATMSSSRRQTARSGNENEEGKKNIKSNRKKCDTF